MLCHQLHNHRIIEILNYLSWKGPLKVCSNCPAVNGSNKHWVAVACCVCVCVCCKNERQLEWENKVV